MINFAHAERDVLQNPSNTSRIEEELLQYKSIIDNIMSMFIDQYGHKLDVESFDKYYKFHKHQSEEYAKITRLQRVIKAYKNK